MKATRIYLYQSEIHNNRNMIVDNMTDYLAKIGKITPIPMMVNFVKLGLNMEIVVPTKNLTSYELIRMDSRSKKPNYMSMDYGDLNEEQTSFVYQETYYAFINSIEWRSDASVKINATLDVLNSFNFASSIFCSKNSVIHRAHRDRFITSPNDSHKMRIKIDETPEGLSPVLYNKSADVLSKVQQKISSNNLPSSVTTPMIPRKWYLIYRTESQPSTLQAVNPLKCTITADESFRIKKYYNAISTTRMNSLNVSFIRVTSAMNSGKDLYFSLPFKSKVYKLSGDWSNYARPFYYLECTPASTASEVNYSYKVANYVKTGIQSGVWETETIESGTGALWFNGSSEINYTNDATQSVVSTAYSGTLTPVSVNRTILGIKSLDRTDSRLVKIIELPYAPFEIGIDNYTLLVSDNVGENNNGELLIYDEEVFKTTIADGIGLTPLFMEIQKPTGLNASFNPDYESKLYHSEFYQQKYFYDSFALTINLEDIANANDVADDSKLHFVVANTIQSKMLFAIDGFYWKRKSEDFQNILAVSRNNEIALYTSQYLDYLRTGYNYDLKAKQRQEISAGVGMSLATIGAVVSGVLGVASGNPAVAVGAIAGGLTGVASSVVSNVNNIISQEQSLQAKLATLKAQSVSVSNIDDVSLLDYYTQGNKLCSATYELSDKAKNAIAYLFHCTGYKLDVHDDPLNYMNTRKWFNFIQADLDIAHTLPIMQEDMIEDIKRRFAEGVFIFHKNVISGVNTWNFTLSKENWEVSMYEGS